MEKSRIDEKYVNELRNRIRELNHAYHDLDAPIVDDRTYDLLVRELEEIEEEFPEYRYVDSPTQVTGGEASAAFKKITHDIRMGSLQDVFSIEELASFIDKTSRLHPSEEIEWVVEQKIDGLSVSLEYRDGTFYQAATRGDGNVGEDITENIRTIDCLPKELIDKDVTRCIVRCEVYMSKASFDKLNLEQEALGQKTFANPRNAAAGSLRQLNPKISRERDLSFFAFNIQLIEPVQFQTHVESLEFLKRNQFPVIDIAAITKSTEEVLEAIEKIDHLRISLSYGIDGAVIKVNNLRLREELGYTSKYPRWACAYKYPPEQAETTVEDISIQVGRSGRLTPLAELKPVFLAGSLISRATLHNEDFIKAKDVRIGDQVIIQKAGDIIPELVRVLTTKRTDDVPEYEMPKTCPSCGAEVIRREGEAASFCSGLTCPAQQLRHLTHFTSKACMSIDGLGPAIIETFYNEGLLQNIADIYTLAAHKEQILDLPGWGQKSLDNLLQSIERSKELGLDRLIFALGIPQVGAAASRALAQHFQDIWLLSQASVHALQSIPDIGPSTAKEIENFFSNEQNIQLIKELEELGVQTKLTQGPNENQSLLGLRFVITGSLEGFSRSEAEDRIRALGGVCSSSVSKKTSYVILGENAGTKEDKARALGVPILSEEDFNDLLENPEKFKNIQSLE